MQCIIIKHIFIYFDNMQQKLAFTIQKTKGKARVGHFILNGQLVQTPCFMPVGTQATIKSLPLEFLTKKYL